MILGKFLPPHRGHQHLVDFARGFCESLTVLVCSIEREPIPGDLRYMWMREMFPDVRVVSVTEELPQEPSEHPDFWQLWHDAIRRVLPEGPDYVFASEPYGFKLADVLGAQYIPVDPDRRMVPISGRMIREEPMRYWDFIPRCVRPYFVKRVCVFGPESTGKSTLARDLAEHFHTVHVTEFARGLLDQKQGRCDPEDIPLIARGQAASEDALARQANRVLICDTDLLTTSVWSDVLFGSCPAWIVEEAERREYDLYLLTDVDAPWVADSQRYLPHRREEFRDRCIRVLESRSRPYVRISGSWEQRLRQARKAVDRLIA